MDAEFAWNCPACRQQGRKWLLLRGLDACGYEPPNSEHACCHRRPCLSDPVGKLYGAVPGRCLAGCPGVFLSWERRRKNVRGRERKDIDTHSSFILLMGSISCLNIFPPCGLAGTSGVRIRCHPSVSLAPTQNLAQRCPKRLHWKGEPVVRTQPRPWLPKVEHGSLGSSQTALSIQERGNEKDNCPFLVPRASPCSYNAGFPLPPFLFHLITYLWNEVVSGCQVFGGKYSV